MHVIQPVCCMCVWIRAIREKSFSVLFWYARQSFHQVSKSKSQLQIIRDTDARIRCVVSSPLYSSRIKFFCEIQLAGMYLHLPSAYANRVTYMKKKRKKNSNKINVTRLFCHILTSTIGALSCKQCQLLDCFSFFFLSYFFFCLTFVACARHMCSMLLYHFVVRRFLRFGRQRRDYV